MVKPCKRDFAMHDARFEIHHAIHVGEVTRQHGIDALHLAGTEAQSQASREVFFGPRFCFHKSSPRISSSSAGLPSASNWR